MTAFVVLCSALFGLLIGSFLNVVAYRVPAGLSVVSPPSACPGCESPITARDNVPLLSWLLLRGACRHCGMRISVRYPLVEAGTAVAFAVAALPFASGLDVPADPRAVVASAIELTAFLYLAAISVALSVIDLDVKRLPDRIVLPAYLVGAVSLGAVDVLRGDPAAFGVAALGAGASALFYAVLWFAKPGGMGLGDVKLAGVVGLFLAHLGVAQLVVGTAAGFLIGGLIGIAVIVGRRGTRRTAIPFGPCMLAGAWVGVLAGEPLAEGYLRLVGLA
jgi:leader peptidase (prepilin peptidase)/N-methyltransferase